MHREPETINSSTLQEKLMILNLAGLSAIILFGILGYFRGVFRMVGLFFSFLLAGLLAQPLSGMFKWMLSISQTVPKGLVPLAAILLAGLILFMVFSAITSRFLRNREDGRQQLNLPKISSSERFAGGLMGGVWGLFLLIFTLTGLHFAGSIQETLLASSQKYENDSSGVEMSPYGRQSASPLEMKLAELMQSIELSAFGDVVQKVDPVDEKVKQTFRDLRHVVTTPELLSDFRNHPAISQFTDNPDIRALSEDSEIRYLLQSGEYYRLLDHPKVAALLSNETLYNELKGLDMNSILKQVLAGRREYTQ